MALEGCEWSAARSGCTLPPGKAMYSLCRRMDGPQGRSGWAENFAPPGFNPRTVQLVVSRYIDWETRPDFQHSAEVNNKWNSTSNSSYAIIAFIGLLARSQYSEDTTTGHLDTGFSWFPCVYKRMLSWLPRLQVATTCFSCSPPDLNLLVTNFIFCVHVK